MCGYVVARASIDIRVSQQLGQMIGSTLLFVIQKKGKKTYGSVRPNLTRGVVGVPERSVRVAKRPGDLIPGDAAIPSKVEDGVLFVL